MRGQTYPQLPIRIYSYTTRTGLQPPRIHAFPIRLHNARHLAFLEVGRVIDPGVPKPILPRRVRTVLDQRPERLQVAVAQRRVHRPVAGEAVRDIEVGGAAGRVGAEEPGEGMDGL